MYGMDDAFCYVGSHSTEEQQSQCITIVPTVECLTHIITLTLLGDSSSFCLQKTIHR